MSSSNTTLPLPEIPYTVHALSSPGNWRIEFCDGRSFFICADTLSAPVIWDAIAHAEYIGRMNTLALGGKPRLVQHTAKDAQGNLIWWLEWPGTREDVTWCQALRVDLEGVEDLRKALAATPEKEGEPSIEEQAISDGYNLLQKLAATPAPKPSEADKAIADMVDRGTGIMRDGKHVPFDDVFTNGAPTGAQAQTGRTAEDVARNIDEDAYRHEGKPQYMTIERRVDVKQAAALIEAHVQERLAAAPVVPAAVKSQIITIAAECHKAKWKFSFDNEDRLLAKDARRLVAKAFDDLHRIGDLAIKLKDALTTAPAQPDLALIREEGRKQGWLEAAGQLDDDDLRNIETDDSDDFKLGWKSAIDHCVQELQIEATALAAPGNGRGE